MTKFERLSIHKAAMDAVPGWGTYFDLLDSVVQWLPDSDSKVVEVGVLFGRMIRYLYEEMQRSKKTGLVYAVDHFLFKTKDVGLNVAIEQMDGYDAFIRYCGQTPIIPVVSDSAQAANRFKDESFDFVFVDASHQQEDVEADLKAWWPKVKKGGILAGDDFNPMWPGVVEAVTQAFDHNICAKDHTFATLKAQDGTASSKLPFGW